MFDADGFVIHIQLIVIYKTKTFLVSTKNKSYGMITGGMDRVFRNDLNDIFKVSNTISILYL